MKKSKVISFFMAVTLCSSVAFAEPDSWSKTWVTLAAFEPNAMFTCTTVNLDNANKSTPTVKMDTSTLDADGFCAGQNCYSKYVTRAGHLDNMPVDELET